MHRYLSQRVLQGLVLLFLVSVVMFTIIRMAPGGPAVLVQQDITKEMAETMSKELGLDKPIYVQYGQWLWGLMHGDFGRSLSLKVPVGSLIKARMGATLWLAGASLVLSVVLAIPLGVLSAVKRYSIFDYLATGIAFLGVSIPVFWFGLMLIILFSVELKWLPGSGMYTIGADFSLIDRLTHLILPAIVLSSSSLAQLARYTRSSMLSALKEDFVRTARAKGVAERVVLYKHTLRNALIPVITMLGVLIPRLVGGAAITESIFSWPGMGRLAVDAAFQRDYPVIMALTLLVSVMVILAGGVIDIIYVLIDPRIKYD